MNTEQGVPPLRPASGATRVNADVQLKMKKETGKKLTILGLVLQAGFLAGFFLTLVGVMKAVSQTGNKEDVQLSELAPAISMALHPLSAGILASTLGSVFLLMALFGSKYRTPWFREVMWIFAFLWLIFFPIGTVVGIITMVFLKKHKNDFTDRDRDAFCGAPLPHH